MTEVIPAPVSDYDLKDRYRPGRSGVVLTGVQALARLMVEQHQADLRDGLKTASFVSGYQGSPLGGVDRMLAEMPEVLEAHDIVFVPGVNEELAATAVWGSQAELPTGNATHNGVVGYWYGKAPGVDRATDAFRHANMYGANATGGMVIFAGDDPASKSSTVPAVSERSLSALGIPVLFPRNATEIVSLGMHAVRMSRASGCLVALKIVADVADGAWTIDGPLGGVDVTVPTITHDGTPWNYRQRPMSLAAEDILGAEADLVGPRTRMVHAYAAANNLNQVDVDSPDARIGIVAAGTCYDSTRQALIDLGLSDDSLREAGIRVLRLGMVTPIEPSSIRAFADGLEEIIVVEDKTSFIETGIRDVLYGVDGAPRVIGKKDRNGLTLFPPGGELNPGRLLAPLRHALGEHIVASAPKPRIIELPLLSSPRSPYFCSGCPHNRSTALPEGSLGGGGIGCHIMVATSKRTDSAVVGLTQMGGEGAQWIGQAAFTDVPHMFQNVGDGTFFHSGQLAVQACVAAGVNITYKVLYNDVVAMTGAQDAEGALSVAQLTHKLTTEGVAQIIVCADEPGRHSRRALAKGTKLWHRDRLDEAQRLLRDIPGVTVLIYDQHCAADARRQRKRGNLPARNTRVVINEAVCEGCGDCGVKSNCLSVQPVDTEFGRKTRIDQTSCNTDYSCLDGDCPSFVTLEVDPAKKAARVETPPAPDVSDPDLGDWAGTQDVFIAGIGGTGIVTVNQVLATAAMRAGFSAESLDQTGMSQKAGPVTGHLRFARDQLEPSNRLTPGSADCILAFDLLTATSSMNATYGDPESTIAVASTSKTPTGEMVYDKNVSHPSTSELLARLDAFTTHVHAFDALQAAERLFGNTTTANFLIVGAAYQAGALRIPAEAIEEAIEINGVAVAANRSAFRWGRVAVADPAAFERAAGPASRAAQPLRPIKALEGVDFDAETRALVHHRADALVDFQNTTLANDYVEAVAAVHRIERGLTEETRLTRSVARHLYKLTAYKDEYEVARLLTSADFLEQARQAVPQGSRLTYKLHPPALRALGWKNKIGLGPRTHFALRLLAPLRRLRGSKLDPFGYAHVRRVERTLRDHYRDWMSALESLEAERYDWAVAVADLPDMVRGYEDVKLRTVREYRARLVELGVHTGTIDAVL